MGYDLLLEIVSGRKPRYTRHGQCNRCGECCSQEDCEHFGWQGNLAVCVIHDSPDRPEKCRMYPANPPTIFSRCGFYFVDNTNEKHLGVQEVE